MQQMSDALKNMAAQAALKYIPRNAVVGIGTGSTVNYFIDALSDIKNNIDAIVVSSFASRDRVKKLNIEILDANLTDNIAVYVDGADEINKHLQMVKGGGGALTGEKIVASIAKKFICIADKTKYVDLLGTFPVAIEVIPMARSFVAREIVKLGAVPVYRENFVTDYNNIILDVHNLKIIDPLKLENSLNNIPGVVTNGIFAARSADLLLLADSDGVKEIQKT